MPEGRAAAISRLAEDCRLPPICPPIDCALKRAPTILTVTPTEVVSDAALVYPEVRATGDHLAGLTRQRRMCACNVGESVRPSGWLRRTGHAAH
jgi:hypothetical protein